MNAHNFRFIRLSLLLALVVSGCQKKQAAVPTGGTGPGGTIISAEKTTFDQVTAKLDKGGGFFLYADTEKVVGKLSATVDGISNVLSSLPGNSGMGDNRDNIARVFTVVSSLIKDSGIEHVSGFGASSIAREPGLYYSKAVLFHEAGENDGFIWTMFGKESHTLKELDFLPENTALATYAEFDLPLLWKTIQKETAALHLPDVDQNMTRFPAQFKQQMGFSLDDLLASLGGGYGEIFTLNESKTVNLPIPGAPMQIPEPGLVIFIKVKSDFIFNQVDRALSAQASIAPMVSKSEVGGVKSLTVTIPIPLPVDLSPTLARSGDYLFLASSKPLLDEVLAVQAGKKSGYKSTAEFKRLSQGVPLEGNNFSIISEKLGRGMKGALQGILSKQSGMMGNRAAALQQMLATNTAGVAFSVAANGPEGWEVVANGNKSMNAMLLPAAIGGAAIGAAIALPAAARAKADASPGQYNQIMNNLRQMDSAKQQWALEKNKTDGTTVTMQDIAPYLPGGSVNVVAGEFYIPNPVGIPPQARLGQAMNGHPSGATVSLANP